MKATDPLCDVTRNKLEFDSASKYLTHANSVKYRQRILSQFVSETTNSNATLEWKKVAFPGQCSGLYLSPNDRFIVAQYTCNESIFARHCDLAFYDLTQDDVALQLLCSKMNMQMSTISIRDYPCIYWLNDNCLCIKYNEKYGTQRSCETCIVNVLERKCYLLENISNGKLFALNDQQFVLIGSEQIECFDIKLKTEPISSLASVLHFVLLNFHMYSMQSHKIIPFDDSEVICAYDQCMKVQWVSRNTAVIILPVFPVKREIDSDFTLSLYIFDLQTFRFIDMECNIYGVRNSTNNTNAPQFVYNTINPRWNWVNNNHFFVINDTQRSENCAIYKCEINLDCITNKCSMQISKLPEIKKNHGEEPESKQFYLLIHPLSHENIIFEEYSKRIVYSFGNYTSRWDKDDYEIKRWHQLTKIDSENKVQRYEYFTHYDINVDQLSGLVLVESKFFHESKSAAVNHFGDLEKPSTYGFDVRNALNGAKVGFIAIPESEANCLENRVSDMPILTMEIGTNCMVMHVDKSKYVHVLMNMQSNEYWSNLLYSTGLCYENRVISDLIATFLCY